MRGRIYGHYRTEDHENCAGGGKARFAFRFYRILSYFREQWLPATPWLEEKLRLSAGSVADASLGVVAPQAGKINVGGRTMEIKG
jgi:hypothetical protein